MKQKLQTPFYNPLKNYEENYQKGPFGGFADGKVFKQTGEPKNTFYGHTVYLPFGIPAGPLLNSNYVKSAFENGFDVCVYKTVRSDFYETHPFPNILSVHSGNELTLERLKKPILADTNFTSPIAISNSFNIPSRKPEIWQEDMKKAISSAGKGQIMVGSFVGTVREGQSYKSFIDDWVTVAKLVLETGAKIIEADISCPNNGAEGLVCYDLKTTEKICKAIAKVKGSIPFILKVGHYENDKQLEKLAKLANEYAEGIAAINTLPGILVNQTGEQALPGKGRKISGVCGAPIKWAGLDMIKRLKKIKEMNNYSFLLDGIGGVTETEDYFEYKKAGADSVFSATGAMWNPYLAQEIKKAL